MKALSDKEAFARLVKALEPYLDTLVFVGGWAHQLYALHELAQPPDFELLATDDADLAAPLWLHARTQSIAERLRDAGFHEEFRGEDSPPIAEYRLGEEEVGLYVEFIAPLVGGPVGRDGKPKDTAMVGGVSAQTLRHVDLLLEEPWSVGISERLGFPVGPEPVRLRVPNPASFIAQKLLVLRKRKPEKRAKDLLYIHDTLLLFGGRLEGLRQSWDAVCGRQHPTLRAKVLDLASAHFAQVDDLVRAAAGIAAATGRPAPPSPERLAMTCLAGARRLFAAR